ncbi:MAG: membrane protein insertase YidC, partial [Elusimicrobiota bacterium]
AGPVPGALASGALDADAPALTPAEPAPSPRRGGLDGAIPFRVGKLEMLVQPLGASVVSYRYPGPLERVELVEDPYPGFFATWPELRFQPAGSDPNWPIFEAVHPSGALIRKEYLFRESDGIHALRLTLTNPLERAVTVGSWSVDLGPGIGTVRSEQKENSSRWRSIVLLPPPEGKKREVFEEFKPQAEAETGKGEWLWIGVHNRYFLAAIFPPHATFAAFVYGARESEVERSSWMGGKKKARIAFPWIGAAAKTITVPAGGSAHADIPFYFGPKGYTHLRQLGHGLERSVSFGWFHRLGRLTLRVLEFFHKWTGNWGWAIILLTVCFQVVMFPLTYKQYKSMAVMKRIQPEITRMQQKFKKDPKRMQVEMMQIYKKHGANPMGGCLPIVVQMPIFIALFNMLRGSWELHGAPWILWVQDLSAKDPFYILPLVMGGIMFLQSKMNPTTTADPSQAKIMTYMPVIFTFMFLNFPAGLVLYWLTNSILSFGQQMAIKRHMEA